jgi:hypothetical protein
VSVTVQFQRSGLIQPVTTTESATIRQPVWIRFRIGDLLDARNKCLSWIQGKKVNLTSFSSHVSSNIASLTDYCIYHFGLEPVSSKSHKCYSILH